MRTTNHFGEQVREKREEMGLTVDGLAAKIHVSGGYLSYIETGERPPPSAPIIDMLEIVLELPARDLFIAAYKDGYKRASDEMIRKAIGEGT